MVSAAASPQRRRVRQRPRLGGELGELLDAEQVRGSQQLQQIVAAFLHRSCNAASRRAHRRPVPLPQPCNSPSSCDPE